jgi:uncharacterized protein YciI
MNLKEGSVLYVRIDSRVKMKAAMPQDTMDSMVYLQGLAKERFLLAGIFGDLEARNIDGAMVIYEAKDLAEAKKLAEDDPIVERGFYKTQVQEWNLLILSSDND